MNATAIHIEGPATSAGTSAQTVGTATGAADVHGSTEFRPTGENRQVLHFFAAGQIAAALGLSKKTVHRRADALRWPREQVGNGFHYCVPGELAARVAVLLESREAALCERRTNEVCAELRDGSAEPRPTVTFADIAHDAKAVAKVELRRAAVEMARSLAELGRDAALALTVQRMREAHPCFGISGTSLRAWEKGFALHGVNGLVEQKRGVVGRRGVEVPEEFVRLGKALVLERGSVAMAARELSTHPDLPAGMRMFLHGGFAQKSYVTPSIKRAITPAILTKELAQGPKTARLNGRWTPGDYSDCRAGDFFVSDDMTSNVICWCEWPNAQGWRIGQAQILPVMDVRTLRWLNVRVIIRDGGQYNAQDDIWGLFGDVFDTFGLPMEGFVLEGGHWQSGVIRGVRTGLDADVRIGGLESLGLRNVRSFDPRSKIIETMFNTFQHFMDRMPGFAGRDQRRDMSEAIKKRVALLRIKNPLHHPREFFPHVSQLADQVKQAMENQNHERQDGKLLRGLSPVEMWAEHNPQLRSIPDSAKWLYRSAMNVSKVTSNGVRICRGSGPKMEVFYYDSPEHLVPLQGRNVIIHWNDSNPDADAIVRLPEPGGAPKFVCVAKRVQPLTRFSATPEQLDAEARRKKAALHYARTELRSIQPDLVRDTVPIPVGVDLAEIGAEIAAADARAGAVVTGADMSQAGRLAGAGGAGGAVERPKSTRAVLRGAVVAFGGQPFTLAAIRAKLPGALHPLASIMLRQLMLEGEVTKTRRDDGSKVWQATAALKVRGPVNATPPPAPGSLIANRDGSKTYILEPQTAGAVPVH